MRDPTPHRQFLCFHSKRMTDLRAAVLSVNTATGVSVPTVETTTVQTCFACEACFKAKAKCDGGRCLQSVLLRTLLLKSCCLFSFVRPCARCISLNRPGLCKDRIFKTLGARKGRTVTLPSSHVIAAHAHELKSVSAARLTSKSPEHLSSTALLLHTNAISPQKLPPGAALTAFLAASAPNSSLTRSVDFGCFRSQKLYKQ